MQINNYLKQSSGFLYDGFSTLNKSRMISIAAPLFEFHPKTAPFAAPIQGCLKLYATWADSQKSTKQKLLFCCIVIIGVATKFFPPKAKIISSNAILFINNIHELIHANARLKQCKIHSQLLTQALLLYSHYYKSPTSHAFSSLSKSVTCFINSAISYHTPTKAPEMLADFLLGTLRTRQAYQQFSEDDSLFPIMKKIKIFILKNKQF